MTYVLNEVYGKSIIGIRSFSLNRFLLIYLSCIFVLVVALLIVNIALETAKNVAPSMQLPATEIKLLKNVMILGLTFNESSRLIPPAWPLNIEPSYIL